jgi:hypothetical protein
MNVATARNFVLRMGVALLVTATLALGATSPAAAQGVTTGAIRGRILDTTGQPIQGAVVMLTNRNSGARFQGTTGNTGAFFIANVVIGPYIMDARAIGHQPAGRNDLVIGLGQVANIELRLQAVAIEVAAITTVAEADNALMAPSRTGPISVVSENLVRNLPTINRNFMDFTRTNSQVNGGSIAGQSDRFNQLQIDGGSNGDLFGLNSSNSQPGGKNGSRAISIEAVQEVQVLIAPYDNIRQGSFTGGLINAVTKSGTNEFHGTAFYTRQGDALVGADSAGGQPTDFSLDQYGFSLGGPIIRDRLHFFVSGEWRAQTAPFGGVVVIGTDTTGGKDSVNVGIRNATAERVRDFTNTTYGFNPGGYGRPAIPNPDMNLFAKLSAQIGSSSQVELSFNRQKSSQFITAHLPGNSSLTNIRDGYQYDNTGYDNASYTNGMRLRLNTPFASRFTNELLVSYNYFSDVREMSAPQPMVVVGADRHSTAPTAVCTPFAVPVVTTGCPTTFLSMGGERFSHDNVLNQKILEVSDNVTVSLGSHVLTIGGRAERFSFLNRFWAARYGAWSFADTTAFFAGTPSRYEIALPGSAVDPINGRTDGPIANFVFSQYGAYAQDQFQATSALTLTLGLRVDFQGLPAPAYNPRIDSAAVTAGPNAGQLFGVRTDTKITHATLVSPRFGFNYALNSDRSSVLRGGIGVFSGRTPYVWASNAYTNTGLEQVLLVCDGALTTAGGSLDTVPIFSFDPTQQPTNCGAGSSTAGLTAASPQIVYFDQNFRLPQNLRASIGLDRRLPWGLLGSFDVLYSRALNQFILEDVNLVPGGTSLGEASRHLYGTLSATSSSTTPRRATAAARDVIRQFNSNRDYAYSFTAGLNKRFSNGMEFSAGYTFSHAYDLISATSDISNSTLRFSILDGTFADRRLRPSFWDTPHSVRLSGAVDLPAGVRFALIYSGTSGRPYSWTSSSDLNADGFAGNDLIYVPVNAQDISLANSAQWTTLDNFIKNEPCLNRQRGHIMSRTSCRNPWRGLVDAKAIKSFRTVRGQSMEVMASVYNVLSLLGVGGKIYTVTGFENASLLTRTGYSTALSRGIYSLDGAGRAKMNQDINASRWKLELGARYIF